MWLPMFKCGAKNASVWKIIRILMGPTLKLITKKTKNKQTKIKLMILDNVVNLTLIMTKTKITALLTHVNE